MDKSDKNGMREKIGGWIIFRMIKDFNGGIEGDYWTNTEIFIFCPVLTS